MGINEKAWHVGFKWTIGNEDVPAGALCVDNTSKQLHICDIEDAGTDWNVGIDSYPSVYIHDIADPSTDYVKIYHNGTNGIIDCDGTSVFTMTENSVNVGTIGAGADFLLHATSSSGKFHWDEDANVLYIIATTMMGYGSQFQFTPGGVGAGTGISFHNTAQYIRSVAGNVLEISGQAYLNIASKIVLANTIALTYDVTPSLLGELALASDNRLQYCVSTAPIIYKVPFYDYTNTGDVILPTGVGLQLGDKIRLQVSTSAPSTAGELCLDSNDNMLTYFNNASQEWKAAVVDDAGKLRLPEGTATATIRGQVYLDSDNLITYSPGSSLEYKVPCWNAAGGDLVLPIGVGLVLLSGYIKLFNTHVNGTREGEIWYNDLSHKLQFLNAAGAAETVNSS